MANLPPLSDYFPNHHPPAGFAAVRLILSTNERQYDRILVDDIACLEVEWRQVPQYNPTALQWRLKMLDNHPTSPQFYKVASGGSLKAIAKRVQQLLPKLREARDEGLRRVALRRATGELRLTRQVIVPFTATLSECLDRNPTLREPVDVDRAVARAGLMASGYPDRIKAAYFRWAQAQHATAQAAELIDQLHEEMIRDALPRYISEVEASRKFRRTTANVVDIWPTNYKLYAKAKGRDDD